MPIAPAFFLSGAAALILQVLWTRMLGHVLGASALAVSTVLTVFMGGLALGSHLAGRNVSRIRRPLVVFAALEAGVGLYGLLVPTLLEALPAVQGAWIQSLGDGRWGYALLRFLLACVVLIVPTTAMGATLPVLAEAVVRRVDRMAEKTGQLYAANTFGAVFGALAAGFWLIPTYGLSKTVFIAAGIDLGVAAFVLVAFSLGKGRLLVEGRRELTPGERLLQFEPSLRVVASDAERTRALWLLALSGATAMVLEVLWTRAVGVVIGASTYAFTLILVTFLVGLAVGAAAVSRVVGRLRDPVLRLGQVELTAGLLSLLAALVIDRLPLWLHSVTRDETLTDGGLYAAHFFMTGAVTLPATLALGAVLPLVLIIVSPPPGQGGVPEAGAAGVDEPHAGAIVGSAYALNTLGAIIGSFAGGFVILPLLGVEAGLEWAGLSLCGLGLFLLKDRIRSRSWEVWVGVGACLLVLTGPRWDIERWTAGMFRFYLARDVYEYGWSSSTDIIYHRDGVATTVTVGQYRGRDDGLGVVLKVNGKVDASDIGDMPTQVLSGLLPVLLHPAPKDVLVIGYGSGVTPGALLQAPINRLWVAEIESAVYEAANTHFAHVNHRPFNDSRARLVVDDGRNFLLTRPQNYDLIVSEPSNPWMSGAASLFTLDFFEVAKRRLKPDGIFLQWLQLYELSTPSINALVRTFHTAFPHVLIFTPDPHSNDTFLIGSRFPLRVERERVAGWMKDPKVQEELRRARVFEPDDLVGLFFLGETKLPPLIGSGPLNTDDNALIEFQAPKDLLKYGTRDAPVPFRDFARGRRRELVTEDWFAGFSTEPEALRHRSVRLFRQGRLADARDHAESAQEAGVDAQPIPRMLAWVEGPDDQAVVVNNDQTRGHLRYAEAVRAMLEGRDRDALALVEQEDDSRWTNSPGHAFLRAFLLYREERTLEAAEIFDKLSEEDGFVARHPEVLFYAGRAAAELHRWETAFEHLERYDWVAAP